MRNMHSIKCCGLSLVLCIVVVACRDEKAIDNEIGGNNRITHNDEKDLLNTSYTVTSNQEDLNLVWTFIEGWDLPDGKVEVNFHSCTSFLLIVDGGFATFVTVRHGVEQFQFNVPEFKYRKSYNIALVNCNGKAISLSKDSVTTSSKFDLAFIRIPIREIDESIQLFPITARFKSGKPLMERSMPVYLLGFPFNREKRFTVCKKEGLFKGIMFPGPVKGIIVKGKGVFATDILPTFGFSGGPLISQGNGHVIGMFFKSYMNSSDVKSIALPVKSILDEHNALFK